jgi:hypothetical protein
MDWLSNNWEQLIGATSALLTAIIAISLMIPGEQPEKALKAIVAMLEKISKK